MSDTAFICVVDASVALKLFFDKKPGAGGDNLSDFG